MDNFEMLVSELLGKAVNETKKYDEAMKECAEQAACVAVPPIDHGAGANSNERVIEIRYMPGNEKNPSVKFNNDNEDMGAVVCALSIILNKLSSDEEHGFEGVDTDLIRAVMFYALEKLVKDHAKKLLLREFGNLLGGMKHE